MALSRRKIRLVLALLVALGGAARLGGVLFGPNRGDKAIFDDFPYAGFGRALNYSFLFSGNPEAQYKVPVARGIGYPALWASLYSPDKARHLLKVFTAQALLGTLGILLVYRIGARAFGPGAGLLAALLFAFDPLQIVYAGNAEIESFYTVLLLCLCELLLYALSAPWYGALLLGAAAGVTMMSRTLFFLFPPYLLLLALLRGADLRALARRAALFAAGFLAVLSPWIAGNRAIEGRWALFQRGEGNHNFYMACMGYVHTPERGEFMARVRQERPGGLAGRTLSEENDEVLSISLGEVAAKPGKYLASLAARTALYGPLFVLLPWAVYRRRKGNAAAEALCAFHLYFAVYLAAAICLKYVMVALPFAGLLAAGLLLRGGDGPEEAGRFPYEACLVLLAAEGIAAYWAARYALLYLGLYS